MEIQEVDSEVLRKIIKAQQPKGLFLAQEDSLWVAVDNSTGEAWTEDFKYRDDAESWLCRRNHPYARIDSLRSLDLPRLRMEDLRWMYGTGQAQSTGSGRDKKYTYRTGVATPIGDIEIETWIKAAEYMVEREGLQAEVEHLPPFVLFSNSGSPRAKRDDHAHVLSACISQLYRNPEWVGFAEYNQKYHPDFLAVVREKTVAEDKNRYLFPMLPVPPCEASRLFSMTTEENTIPGIIGFYRIGIKHYSTEFTFTWHQRGPKKLITPELKKEVDIILGELRNGPLKTLRDMGLFCRTHGGEIEGGERQSFGYVAETQLHRYYLRCIPEYSEINAYLTCCVR